MIKFLTRKIAVATVIGLSLFVSASLQNSVQAEEVQNSTVTVNEHVQQNEKGAINWDKGSESDVEAIGIGLPPENMGARGNVLARRAAVVDAQRNLAEMIQGVQIDSDTVMENLVISSDVVRTKVSALVRGARIIDEGMNEDGSYFVKMRVPMYGVTNSIATAVLPELRGNAEAEPLPEVTESTLSEQDMKDVRSAAYTGIECTLAALPYVALHGVLILLGYIFFLKALKYTPIALIGLVQSSELFFTTIIDSILGYLSLSVHFFALLLLFVFAIALFYLNSMQSENTSIKTVKPIGIVLTIGTMLLYVIATYIIKVAAAYGANEITLNVGYYVVAIPYFGCIALKGRDDDKKNTANPHWWNGFYFLAIAIGVLETIFYVFETFSFINDTPTIVMAIKQMGIFVMFFLSVLFKTDKFTKPKLFALILGFIAITGLYFN